MEASTIVVQVRVTPGIVRSTSTSNRSSVRVAGLDLEQIRVGASDAMALKGPRRVP